MGKDDDKKGGNKRSGLSLADQLKGLDVEVSEEKNEESEASGAGTSDESNTSNTSGTSEDGGEHRRQQEADPEAMFRQAVDGLSDEEIRQKKYGGGQGVGEGSAGGRETRRGELGDRLEEADVEVAEDADFDEVLAAWEAEQEKDDEERMREAIEGLTAGEIQRRKYGAPSAEQESPSHGIDSEELEAKKEQLNEEAREELERRRQKRQFEAAMYDVERNENRKKYKEPSFPDPDKYLEETGDEDADEKQLITPTLPKHGDGLNWVSPLNGRQKAMKTRWEAWAKRKNTPELSVRGETVEVAISQVGDFVRAKWEDGRQFVRIVPGRGQNSDGPPVLKPAVLKWLENQGRRFIRGYIPERNVAGDYGSLLVELEVTS